MMLPEPTEVMPTRKPAEQANHGHAGEDFMVGGRPAR